MTKAPSFTATAAVLAAALFAAGTACSKSDTAPAPPPPPTSVATTAASASAAPAPSASDTASAAASASAAPSSTVIASASATPSAAPVASASAAPKVRTCGDKPLPPCPLYAWMKANTSAAMSAQDFDALAKALDHVVGFAPAGYSNWGSISRDGAAAARAQSLDGVKASCRSCHNQYKDKSQRDLRDRPV